MGLLEQLRLPPAEDRVRQTMLTAQRRQGAIAKAIFALNSGRNFRGFARGVS